MKIEYVIVGLLLVISVSNFIISKKKINLIKMIIGLFVVALYFCFKYMDFLLSYIDYYLAFDVLMIVVFSMTFIPKKVTKNITEYDFFELEKSYDDLKDDREKLRQRYLSTVSLIDEGVVFYENGCKDVILSEHAHDIFGGKQSRTLEEHLESIYEVDRDEYNKTIERTSKKQMTYEIKYRIKKNEGSAWVLERGHYIGVESKRSIIGVVTTLDIRCYKMTGYFDVDSMYQEDKMYPKLKELIDEKKPFTFVMFELSNIKEINEKYSREIGSLMMNEYIKFLKNYYQKDISKMFRISGIRYVMIIDDYKVYDDFHRDLTMPQSEIYNHKIQIANIKECVVANFGIVNLSGNKQIESTKLVNVANSSLDEAIESNRRNYAIYGE